MIKFKDLIGSKNGIVVGDLNYSATGSIILVGDNINYQFLTSEYKDTTLNKSNILNLVKLNTQVLVPNTNYSLQFNGSTSYITAGTSTPFKSPSGTISCWIKTSASNASYHGIVTAPTYFGLYIYSDKLMAYDFTASTERTLSGPNVNDGLWHHAVFTWQSGVTNGSNLYLDVSNTTAFTYTPSTASSFNFAIGRSLQAAQYFNGQIDDVRLFNRVLTTDEIDKLYNGLNVANESLIHHFKFNEGAGILATNIGASGSIVGTSGTLTNSPTWVNDAPAVNPGNTGVINTVQIFSVQDGRTANEYGYCKLGTSLTALDIYGRNVNINLGSNSTTSGLVLNSGNLNINNAGYGIKIKEGSNATMGITTLSAGVATVNTTAVNLGSRIFLTPQSSGTLAGTLRVSGLVNNTSFTIASNNTSDNANVAWLILNSI